MNHAVVTAVSQARRTFCRLAGIAVFLALCGCSKQDNAPTAEQSKNTGQNSPYVLGTIVTFAKGGDSGRFRSSGWSDTEEQHTWTEGNTAIVRFAGLPPSKPLSLKVTAVGFTKDPQMSSQPTQVYANGAKIADWDVRDKKQYSATIPSGTIDSAGKLTLEFRLPNAASPQSLGVSADSRQLGLCVFDLVIDQAK